MLENEFAGRQVEIQLWEMEFDSVQLEIEKRQHELKEKQMKLKQWEEKFKKTGFISANGIIIKKMYN